MPYVAPSTVTAGQTYTAAAHNIIVEDVIDHEARINSIENESRNLLINGAMQFAQRATSVSGITSGNVTYHTADRWALGVSALGTHTNAVSADAPTGSGFRNSLRTTATVSAATAAASFVYLQQRLEGQTLQHIRKGTSSAQALTLSFWAKGSATGTYTAELIDNDNTRSVSATYTISAADTWEYKTITFPADTTGALDNDNAYSLAVNFWLGAGTNYTSGTLATTWASTTNANRVSSSQVNVAGATNRYLAITGVQLELGSYATDYAFLPYGDELARCQRYYQRVTTPGGFSIMGWGFSPNTSTAYILIPLLVQMRVAPTGFEAPAASNFQVLWSSSATPSSLTWGSASSHAVWVNATSSATFAANMPVLLRDNNTSSAYIGFTGAEL